MLGAEGTDTGSGVGDNCTNRRVFAGHGRPADPGLGVCRHDRERSRNRPPRLRLWNRRLSDNSLGNESDLRLRRQKRRSSEKQGQKQALQEEDMWSDHRASDRWFHCLTILRRGAGSKRGHARTSPTGDLTGEPPEIAYGIRGQNGEGCHGGMVVGQERAGEAELGALLAR